MSDQIVHAAHEEPDLLAAGLSALDPGDLVPADVSRGVALLADQLSVRELAGVVQGLDVPQDAQAGLLPEEAVHHADAVRVHARHDHLQRELLQARAHLAVRRGGAAAVLSRGNFRCRLRRVRRLGGALFRGFLRPCVPPGRRTRLRLHFEGQGFLDLLTNELVLLPVLFLVLLATVEGAPAPPALQEVLHFPAKFTVLPVPVQLALLLLVHV